MEKGVKLVAGAVAGILLFFTARRWLFTWLALRPQAVETNRPPFQDDLPEVLLLVPVRNELETLPELFLSLEQVDYPGRHLTVVFIDDGSTDGSGERLAARAAGRDNWHLLTLARNVGKAEALNTAWRNFPQGQIVAVYDADERPQAGALRQLLLPLADRRVGGVSGRRAVSNPVASLAASYTALEGLVHQLVTMRAKDRLALAPAMLGSNCAYRRAALVEVGGFKPGALLEDTDLTVRLIQAGWRTRFAPEAISYHRVPVTLSGYWQQHTRWARGFNEVARAQGPTIVFNHHLPVGLRLELLTFALGYLDRLALVGAGGLLLLGRGFPFLGWVVVLSLVTPLVQVLVALRLARAPRMMWGRAMGLPLFFGLDVAMALAGFWKTVRQAPQIWEERRVRG
jgi:cellulose synthase/poly-beta-1,6-N-acetylglucosamine synthase-like glycosyltransferase